MFQKRLPFPQLRSFNLVIANKRGASSQGLREVGAPQPINFRAKGTNVARQANEGNSRTKNNFRQNADLKNRLTLALKLTVKTLFQNRCHNRSDAASYSRQRFRLSIFRAFAILPRQQTDQIAKTRKWENTKWALCCLFELWLPRPSSRF